MMADSMQALYYIALECDAKEHNTDEENKQWRKSNQNRLNQNFTAIAGKLDALEARLSALEKT